MNSNLDSQHAYIFITSHMLDINFVYDWIIDSGCSNHLIIYREIFVSLHDYIGSDAIVAANNLFFLVKVLVIYILHHILVLLFS